MAFHKKDDSSINPRFQCRVCAKWMRLNGRDEQGLFQRCFASYETLDGKHIEHDGDVCVACESKMTNWKPYKHQMVKI